MSRYQYQMRSARRVQRGGEPKRAMPRLSGLLCIALVIALGVTLSICLPGLNYRDEVRDQFIANLQTECDTAMTNARYLSRNASSGSNEQLAVIRSSIRTMEVINDTYSKLENGTMLVDQTLFNNLYTVIQNYFNRLNTGMNTADYLTDMTLQLESLQQLVVALN
ncbi:MAG: hypothetical protein Q4E72_02055 [bacterium]|nr:hypothetical protein [bacterium]